MPFDNITPGISGQNMVGENILGGSFGPFGLGLFNSGFGIFIALITLAVFIFWIWMLVDMVQRPVKNKTMWAIILVFTHIIGALVYCFTARKNTPMPEKKVHHHPNPENKE